jgi:hypothetical protein
VGVDDGGTGAGFASFCQAHFFPQYGIPRAPLPILAPRIVIEVYRLPLGELVRQHSPLSPALVHVEYRIQDFSHLCRAWLTAQLGGRDEWFQNGSLFITEVAWVCFSIHPPSLSSILVLSPGGEGE